MTMTAWHPKTIQYIFCSLSFAVNYMEFNLKIYMEESHNFFGCLFPGYSVGWAWSSCHTDWYLLELFYSSRIHRTFSSKRDNYVNWINLYLHSVFVDRLDNCLKLDLIFMYIVRKCVPNLHFELWRITKHNLSHSIFIIFTHPLN